MLGTQNTSTGDVSYINCKTKITVQLVPQESEIFIQIETIDKNRRTVKCQLLERPVATTSASALAILARHCVPAVCTQGLKQGEESATIRPGCLATPLLSSLPQIPVTQGTYSYAQSLFLFHSTVFC